MLEVLGQAGSGTVAATCNGHEEPEKYSGDGGVHAGFMDQCPGGDDQRGSSHHERTRRCTRMPNSASGMTASARGARLSDWV